MEQIMGYQHIKVPSSGEKIIVNEDCSLSVPEAEFLGFEKRASPCFSLFWFSSLNTDLEYIISPLTSKFSG